VGRASCVSVTPAPAPVVYTRLFLPDQCEAPPLSIMGFGSVRASRATNSGESDGQTDGRSVVQKTPFVRVV
jgi:hypothetical protein